MKGKTRTRRKRRLQRQRIKSGKIISRHNSKSGRTGQIKRKQTPSSKTLNYRTKITNLPTSAALYNVYKKEGYF